MSFWSEVDNLIQKGKADKQIKVAVAELVDLRNEINDKEIKIEELEKNIEEQVQKSKGQIEQYQQYIQQLKVQNTELGQKTSLKGEETEQFDQRLEIEHQKTEEALEQSESLMAQNQELIKQIQTFRSQIQQLENPQTNLVSVEQINEKNQEIMQLKMAGRSLLEQIKKIQSDAIDPEEFEDLKRSYEHYRAEAAAGTQKYEMLQREITKLRNEIAEKDKKIKELSQPRQVMTPTLGGSEIAARTVPERELTVETDLPPRQTIRNKCPNCGSVNYREVEDKSKIVSYIPRTIYGKKLVCMKCSFSW